MKRTVTLLCAAAIAFTAGTAAVITRATRSVPAAAIMGEQTTQSADTRQYILREHNGRLAVFLAGRAEPLLQTDMTTHNLRHYDRELLLRGIEVTGYENLLGLLEDFSN